MASSVEELYWAAGFFDGEGTFCINKGRQPNDKWSLQTSIKQVDIRPLQRFALAVNLGNIGGPYQGNLAYRQGQYRWSAYRKNAETVGNILKPFLSEPKIEQLERVLKEINKNNTKESD